jgi:hypothetical protein
VLLICGPPGEWQWARAPLLHRAQGFRFGFFRVQGRGGLYVWRRGRWVQPKTGQQRPWIIRDGALRSWALVWATQSARIDPHDRPLFLHPRQAPARPRWRTSWRATAASAWWRSTPRTTGDLTRFHRAIWALCGSPGPFGEAPARRQADGPLCRGPAPWRGQRNGCHPFATGLPFRSPGQAPWSAASGAFPPSWHTARPGAPAFRPRARAQERCGAGAACAGRGPDAAAAGRPEAAQLRRGGRGGPAWLFTWGGVGFDLTVVYRGDDS